MVLRKLMGLFACVLIIGAASFASAGVPDLQTTTANTFYHTPVIDGGLGGTETLSLFNMPNGAGEPFTGAFLFGSATTDATINLVLRDGFGVPIDNFPAADMWIENPDDDPDRTGLVACGGTASADFNTNAAGETLWQAPIFGGGQSYELTIVKINGDALTSNGGLALRHNSPDINGDGTVNLSDAGFFTSDVGTTRYRSDFNYDGQILLQDAGFMKRGLGSACP